MGKGALWGMPRFYDYAERHFKGVTREKLWDEILVICRSVVLGIASHPTVKGHKLIEGRHYQTYGLDLMPDDTGRVTSNT